MKQVGILGGSGYTGSELLRLLTTHPDYEVKVVTGDSMAGHMVHEVIPQPRFGISKSHLPSYETRVHGWFDAVPFMYYPTE